MLLCVSIAGCASTTISSPEAKWLPTEQVHASLRRKFGLEPGHAIKSCGHLVVLGLVASLDAKGEAVIDDPREALQDSMNEYYDNRSGKMVGVCKFVQGTKEGKHRETCPPKSWKCS